MSDIIFLQETHVNKEEHCKLEKFTSAQVFASSQGTAKRGVVVLSKSISHIRLKMKTM